MKRALGRFVREDSGLEMVEWAIVGGVVIAVGALLFQMIGSDTSSSLSSLHGVTQAAAEGSG